MTSIPVPEDLDLRTLPRLGVRSRFAHKDSFGRVTVLGGAPEYGGALALAAKAAYRVGAGVVTAMGHSSSRSHVAALVPEATWSDWPARLVRRLSSSHFLAFGPGLGQGLAGHDYAREAGSLPGPQLWDADALNILARLGPGLLKSGATRIFTPHPGEAARLLDCSSAAVQENRPAAIQALAERYGGIWILKGESTLLWEGRELRRCPWGNPGMATGGSGDVLTGVIVGLWAQGLAAWEAAQLGVAVHARAGDRAAARLGEASVLAGDLIEELPMVLQELDQS